MANKTKDPIMIEKQTRAHTPVSYMNSYCIFLAMFDTVV